MAGILIVKGLNFTAMDQMGANGPGNYYALPPYGIAPCIEALEYEEQLVTIPGVNYVGTKIAGIRGCLIQADLVFAGATKALCQAARDAAFGNDTNPVLCTRTRYSLTLPTAIAPINGVKLIRGTGMISSWNTYHTNLLGGGVGIFCICPCVWNYMGPTSY